MAWPKIAIASFQHETNTFAPFVTDWDQFMTPGSWPAYCVGDQKLETCTGLNIPVSGFIETASMCDLVPISYAVAEPGGLVAQAAVDAICDRMLAGIKAAGRLDGLYLDLHGAMVTEQADDGEALLLQRIRSLVGADFPIVVSLDLHGNIGPDFCDLVSALVIYRTYPHVDMAETGCRAARVFDTILRRQKLPYKSFQQVDFMVPITAQSTRRQPGQQLYQRLEDLESEGVLSVDLAFGFPPADIPNCGISVFACGYDQAAVTAATATVVAALDAAEGSFDDQLMAVDAAVQTADDLAKQAQRPVVIADPQDNPGAGSSGDST